MIREATKEEIDRYLGYRANHIALVQRLGKLCFNADFSKHDMDKIDVDKNDLNLYALRQSPVRKSEEEQKVIRALANKHMLKAPHHPENWDDLASVKDLKTAQINGTRMPDEYIKEMVCDWVACALNKQKPIFEWYNNKCTGDNPKYKFSTEQKENIIKYLTHIQNVVEENNITYPGKSYSVQQESPIKESEDILEDKELLLEKIYGNVAIVYHRGNRDKLNHLLKGTYTNQSHIDFDNYNKALYTTFDLESQLNTDKHQKNDMRRTYGDYIIKLAVKGISNFWFCDYNTYKQYHPNTTPETWKEEQFKKFNISKELRGEFGNNPSHSFDHVKVSKIFEEYNALEKRIKGIIYYGRHDGNCALIYDWKTVVPISISNNEGKTWEKITKEETHELRQNFSKNDYIDTNKKMTRPLYRIDEYGNVTVSEDAISLYGVPDIVEGDFNCSGCENLASLEGAPSTVKGSFNCYDCRNLKSLKGAPETVEGDFDCNSCDNLTSLEGAPDIVEGTFWCYCCDNLTSLKGAPKKVNRDFICSYCENLISLEGAPTKVGGNFYCSGCLKLTSLAKGPTTVGRNFDCCGCNNLTSLAGAPTTVEGDFCCRDCDNLTSLDGFNTKITGGFFADTKLKQLYDQKYKESKYIDFFKYYEADRTRFISKNPNLSNEQKKEVIETFKKYPAIDKDIKWGSNEVNNWSYNDFKPYLDRAGATKSQAKKNGLAGLVEGKDYIILEDHLPQWIAYQPLTHLGSKILASNKVPPVIYPRSTVMDWAHEDDPSGGAKWCISMNNDTHWNDYIKNDIKFIFLFNFEGKSDITKKVAVSIKDNNYYVVNYADDSDDHGVNIKIKDFNEDIQPLKDKLQDYAIPDSVEMGLLVLNKETNRYDCKDINKIRIKSLIENGKFKYPLGVWNGSFDCSETDLTSLEGAPTEVKGYFDCSSCNNLTSLQGAPKIVRGSFYCNNCNNLTSLEGAPQTVEGDFYCKNCTDLKSLEGAPQPIWGGFYCEECTNLTSLVGAPQTIDGGFYCDSCNNLTSLEGAPQIVGGNFDCSWCNNLTSLGGAPQTVKGTFYCYGFNNPTFLDGFNTQIDGSFIANDKIMQLYNQKYKESKYIDFFKYYEADRTRFISKNPNLSDSQKQEVIEIFKKYPTIDKDIKWGSNEVNNWSYEQFKPYLDRAGKSISQSKKKKLGILRSGLELGKDYLILEQNDKAIAYQPLTYYASRIIASNDTPPKVEGEVAKDENVSGAKWCISWQKQRYYWDSHAIESKEVFVMICGEDIPTKKVCLTVSKNNVDADNRPYYHKYKELNYNIWDFNDDNTTIKPSQLEPFINLNKLIVDSYNNYSLVLENHERDIQKTQDIVKSRVVNKLKFNPTTGRYDCTAEILETLNTEELIVDGKFVVPLGVWEGTFDCSGSGLTSLENAPQIIEGDMYCGFCPNLVSLEGCPQEIYGNFECQWNEKLLSLEGGPKLVEGDYDCSNCDKITSLKGAPPTIKGDFYCVSCNSLTSLEGGPNYVEGIFNCRDCHNLETLKEAPRHVGSSFSCQSCWSLKNLIGAPRYVGGTFICIDCRELISFEGAPKKIGKNFTATQCYNLKSKELNCDVGGQKIFSED